MTEHRVRKRSDAEQTDKAGPRQTALRWAAIAAWSASLVWFVFTSGMPSDPPLVDGRRG